MARVFRRDQGCGGLRVGQQAAVGFQGHGGDRGHVQPHLVVEIPRRRQDHLVPRPGKGGHDGREGLIAALGDGNLIGADGAAIGRRPLRGDFRAQGGQAQDGAVKMRLRVVQGGVRDGLTQAQRRAVHRGGLADVDQRAVGGKGFPGDPATGLHHRRRLGRGEGGVQRMGHRGAPVGPRDRGFHTPGPPWDIWGRMKAGGRISPCRGRAGRIAAPCPRGRISRYPG